MKSFCKSNRSILCCRVLFVMSMFSCLYELNVCYIWKNTKNTIKTKTKKKYFNVDCISILPYAAKITRNCIKCLTCKRIDYLAALHIIQIGRSLPWRCDRLLSGWEPISANHHAHVTCQLNQRLVNQINDLSIIQ